MYKILAIAIGGAIGTLARFGMGTLLARLMERTGFPWATMTVNLVGCFLIGYLNGLFIERVLVTPEIRLALLIGFLGGFTTFSSFGWETISFLRDGQYLMAGVNIAANNVIGLLLVLIGYVLGHGRA